VNHQPENRRPGENDDAGQAGPRAPLVVVTGFMGTGKTATGQALAAMLGLRFTDTDRLIEAREGRTIEQIFAEGGEQRFRALEEQVCAELAGSADRAACEGLVVATGGGTLLSAVNHAAFSRPGVFIVLLEASVETIVERVSRVGTRPLLPGGGTDPGGQDLRQRVESLLEERRPHYHRIALRCDTTSITPQRAALEIAAQLCLPVRELTIRFGSPRGDEISHIEIGRGLLSRLAERLAAHGLNKRRTFLLIPANVRIHYLEQIASTLDAAAIPWTEIEVRDGDAHKNLDQAARIIDTLAGHGATRDSLILAAGGGVTGDLAGFVASIYMRGVPLIHLPTTLLAQVDASVGGKAGVNHERAKNLIGSFHQPRLVLSDPCTLRTLPREEIAGGMAEVVKTALIGSPELFALLEKELAGDSASATLRSPAFLERCVAACATVKANIVERDPTERNERRLLNLGHTVGHALEAIGSYHRLTHGQAVSIGLVAALKIAVRRGLADAELTARTVGVLDRCGLPTSPPTCDTRELLDAMRLDKKKRAGRLVFILPREPGAMQIVDDVTDEEILTAIGGAP